MSSKGQIVIPIKMRNQLEINANSIIAIESINNAIVIKKVDEDLINQFKKSLEDVKHGRIRRVA